MKYNKNLKVVSKRNSEYAATEKEYKYENRLKPVKSMVSKSPFGISNSYQWTNMHRKFEVNRMNIKDVVPNPRCEGQMVVPVHLNTASTLLMTSIYIYIAKTAILD